MKRITEPGLSDEIVDCGAEWDGMDPLDFQGLLRPKNKIRLQANGERVKSARDLNGE